VQGLCTETLPSPAVSTHSQPGPALRGAVGKQRTLSYIKLDRSNKRIPATKTWETKHEEHGPRVKPTKVHLLNLKNMAWRNAYLRTQCGNNKSKFQPHYMAFKMRRIWPMTLFRLHLPKCWLLAPAALKEQQTELHAYIPCHAQHTCVHTDWWFYSVRPFNTQLTLHHFLLMEKIWYMEKHQSK
jgi:hypothetical protein